jgi:hypothetical protein
MNRLYFCIAFLIPLLLTQRTVIAFELSVGDDRFVRLNDQGELLLVTNPNRVDPVLPPALLLSVPNVGGHPANSILSIQAETGGPSEAELVAEYVDGISFLLTRRNVSGPSPNTEILWSVPNADRVSTFTLSLRSEREVTTRLRSISLKESAQYSMADRIRAESQFPLRLANPLKPVNDDGFLALILQVPRDAETQLIGSRWVLAVGDLFHEVQIESLRRERDSGDLIADLGVVLANPPLVSTQIKLFTQNGSEEVALLSADLSPVEWPGLFIEDRHLREVSVIERNGELAVYTLSAIHGARAGRSRAPQPVDSVWLSITENLATWEAEQPVLKSRRDVGELAGGAEGLAVRAEAASVLAAFGVVDLQRRRSTQLAWALNSLRVAPIANNPIRPLGDGGTDHAIFFHENARLILSLQQDSDGPRIEALAGNQLPNWLRLGRIDFPHLLPSDRELGGFEYHGRYHLLVGYPARLYTSSHPLHGWEPAPNRLPPWRSPSVVEWNGRLYLFGIVDRNQQGVVRWGELEWQDATLVYTGLL